MIFTTWNCKGVGNCLTVHHVHEIMNNGNLEAIWLLETKTKNCSLMARIAERKEFSNSHVVDPLGFARGLLLLWRPGSVHLEVVEHCTQVIHCILQIAGGRMIRISFA